MDPSRDRAEAVCDWLVRLGVPIAEIGLAWGGERERLVAIDDSVREPQSRRVSITFP